MSLTSVCRRRTPIHYLLKRLISISKSTTNFDYVIVGAGSAGCVLANRLSENPENRVALIEAGKSDNTWTIKMPSALMFNLCHDKYNWYYHTVPQKHMNDRIMYQPRGRVLGGSSSLNAMCYVRGHALDYDRWEKQGAKGWSYEDCLPYFKKAQTHANHPGDDYTGTSGPLKTASGSMSNPLHKAWVKAGQEAGYPFTEAPNGYQQEGVGHMEMTIDKGVRASASRCYLNPIIARPNIKVFTNKMAKKIILNCKKAVGVKLADQKNHSEEIDIMAEKSVILSGGAFNSPQLLMLSGIGDADHLKSLEINVNHHMPGVGSNLQDHLEFYVQERCSKPITLYKYNVPFSLNNLPDYVSGLVRQAKIGIQWFLTHTGDCGTNHLESGGFIRSHAGVEHPDVQFHFLPGVVLDHGREVGDCHAFQTHVGPMRQQSRGTVRLASQDPWQHPLIDFNYLSTERDRWEMRQCLKLTREIFAQPALGEFKLGEELRPGPSVKTDSEIDAFVREKADSAYHPSCTCKMGHSDDPMSVVDENTKVIGLENLHVVDASIMPSVVSGNLNAPTIMLAEKAADHILYGGPQCPPASGIPVWRPEFPGSQRDGTPLVKIMKEKDFHDVPVA